VVLAQADIEAAMAEVANDAATMPSPLTVVTPPASVPAPPATVEKPKKRVLKKDTRAGFIELQNEIDAETDCEGLSEWREAAAPRIRLLPEGWQRDVDMMVEAKMVALANGDAGFNCSEWLTERWSANQAASMARASRPVVWEEDGERPATAQESPAAGLDHTDVNGIPAFLLAQPVATPKDVDEAFWLKHLSIVCGKLTSMSDLAKVISDQIRPNKGKVSPDSFAKAEEIAKIAAGRVAFALV
jgi:hypothetical protein